MKSCSHNWIWGRSYGCNLEEDIGREDHEETFSE